MGRDDRLTRRGHELMQLGRLARRLEDSGRGEDASFVDAMMYAGTHGAAVPKLMIARLKGLVQEVEGVQ